MKQSGNQSSTSSFSLDVWTRCGAEIVGAQGARSTFKRSSGVILAVIMRNAIEAWLVRDPVHGCARSLADVRHWLKAQNVSPEIRIGADSFNSYMPGSSLFIVVFALRNASGKSTNVAHRYMYYTSPTPRRIFHLWVVLLSNMVCAKKIEERPQFI